MSGKRLVCALTFFVVVVTAEWSLAPVLWGDIDRGAFAAGGRLPQDAPSLEVPKLPPCKDEVPRANRGSSYEIETRWMEARIYCHGNNLNKIYDAIRDHSKYIGEVVDGRIGTDKIKNSTLIIRQYCDSENYKYYGEKLTDFLIDMKTITSKEVNRIERTLTQRYFGDIKDFVNDLPKRREALRGWTGPIMLTIGNLEKMILRWKRDVLGASRDFSNCAGSSSGQSQQFLDEWSVTANLHAIMEIRGDGTTTYTWKDNPLNEGVWYCEGGPGITVQWCRFGNRGTDELTFDNEEEQLEIRNRQTGRPSCAVRPDKARERGHGCR